MSTDRHRNRRVDGAANVEYRQSETDEIMVVPMLSTDRHRYRRDDGVANVTDKDTGEMMVLPILQTDTQTGEMLLLPIFQTDTQTGGSV